MAQDCQFILVRPRHYPEYGNQQEKYEERLKEKGLILETEQPPTFPDKNKRAISLTFVKVRVPKFTLRKYYEILHFQMPLKEIPEARYCSFNIRSWWDDLKDKLLDYRNYLLQDGLERNVKETLFAEYRVLRWNGFDESDKSYFNASVAKILVAYYILDRTSWDVAGDPSSVSLKRLLQDGIYEAVYPPHTGCYLSNENERGKLYEKLKELHLWAKKVPIDDIQRYLGSKYGMYVAWMTFYTRFLTLPAIIGLFITLYGVLTLPFDSFSNDVCNSKAIMCPRCDYVCDYFQLNETCDPVKLTYIFHYSMSSVWFSIFICVWSAFLIAFWKRRYSILTHRWGFHKMTEDKIPQRPEYKAIIAEKNTYNKLEWLNKFPVEVLTYPLILFFVLIAFIAAFAVIMNRAWIRGMQNAVGHSSNDFYILTCSSGFLNLLTINLLNTVYPKIALWLNDLELHRTQNKYERSLIVKNYIFNFVNTYASIFYIAFFKGKFVGNPEHYKRIFGIRQEECEYGACLAELSIQLIIIMVGQQIIEPLKKIRERAMKRKMDLTRYANNYNKIPTYITDYDLKDFDIQENGLYTEYLEIAIQYGFIMLFAPVFPLAAFCAFIKNMFVVRHVPLRILKYYRRPIPFRLPNNLIWIDILEWIGHISVLSQAIIIAITSDWIPRTVYYFHNDYSDIGYLNASLRSISVEKLDPLTRPNNSMYSNISFCQYIENQNLAIQNSYSLEILVFRFLFVIIYQNCGNALRCLISNWISNVPSALTELINKEEEQATENMIQNACIKSTSFELPSPSNSNVHLNSSDEVLVDSEEEIKS